MPEPVRPAFDHSAMIHSLLGDARYGALGTLTAEGAPFTSLVALAFTADSRPVIITSHLSGHTGHMERDPRVSLLISDVGKGDPLAHPRLTLTGRAQDARPGVSLYAELRRLYLAQHPKAELYVDLPGFWFWRIEPEAVALNGGFGKAWNGPWSEVSRRV
jgi:heme iron utilization protein